MDYIFIIIFGLVIGSFLNVCIYRIPKLESIAFPPSHCSLCNHQLSFLDLIPVISFVFLRGKCRYCKNKISIRYPLVEILVSILFVLTYHRYGMSYQTIAYLCFNILLTIISFIDLDYKIIPNKLNIVIAVTGSLFVVLGITVSYKDALLGILVGGGVLLILGLLISYLLGKEALGGGDIKLLAASGIYLGWQRMILSIMLSSFIAIIILIVLNLFKKVDKEKPIPYGPFLSIAMIISALYYEQIIHYYLLYMI